MAPRITNGILLEHIQGMRNDLQSQINALALQITRLERKVDQGFAEAREHREALQEDLDATIRLQYKHGRKLERLARRTALSKR